MPQAKDLVALADRIVTSRNGCRIDMQLSLDLCELVRQRTSNARPVLQRILSFVNGFDDLSRKEYLNDLVKRFPAGPRKSPNNIEDYVCLLLSKYAKSLAEMSHYKEEYANFNLVSELLASRGFKVPSIPKQELDAMLLEEIHPKLTPKEVFVAEEQRILETKLEYHLCRKEPEDIKKANELIKVLSGHENRGWKDEALNTILQSQLDELEEKLNTLEAQKEGGEGPSRDTAIEELKIAAPRLANLARSESMNGSLLQRVLELNDRLRELIRHRNGPGTGGDNSGQKGQQQAPTPPVPVALDLLLKTEKVLIDKLEIGGETFLRVFNHSQMVLQELKITDGESDRILTFANQLVSEDTLTIKLDNTSSVNVTYKGIEAPIKTTI